ncbi:MAG: MFS transporter [Chloroflexota bacterium]|nr:MFS transporter [Chloroflexota bacterium]
MSETKRRFGRGRRVAASGRQMFDGAYERADALIDAGQRRTFRLLWFFLPETSIAKDLRFQQILASRFFSDAGQQALTYGALVAVVRGGGGTVEAAIVGAAMLLPPALLGLYGGAVADALPKRVALAAIYNLQALLCFVVPVFFGTELGAVLFLIFAVHALGQVSGPTESAVLPLVASEAQLASAASLVSLASNLGVAFGTAVLAPVLVRVFGVTTVFYVAGALLLFAASRVFDLTTQQHRRPMDWRRPNIRLRATVEWLARERAVATMIFVAVLAGTANIVVQTLAPIYVKEVLGLDPAEAVYVFAPSAVGLVLALAATPPLIKWQGERIVALVGFAITAAVLCLLGLIDARLADLLDPVNPLRVTGLLGLHLSRELRTAGMLALPLGFGLSITTTSVHTYINRRVPLSYQGRAFALQSSLKNGAAIVPLLTLGAAARVFGVANVLIVSPLVLLAIAFLLVRVSFAFSPMAPHQQLNVLSSFWTESDVPVMSPDAYGASEQAPPPGAEAEHDDEH